MQKKGILILLVSLLILVMIGCRAEEPTQDETPQATETTQVEQSEPVEPSKPVESSVPVEPSKPVDEAEPMSVVLQDATQEELEKAFESAYDTRQTLETISSDEDFIVPIELDQLHLYMSAHSGTKFPADIEAQYFTWKEANFPKEAPAPATTPEVQAPSNNPQTQPSVNNQTQPANNQAGPGGAVIVEDPTFVPGEGEVQRFDPNQLRSTSDMGLEDIRPGEIEYGGN